MTISLILDPYYTTDAGEIIGSFLVNSGGLVLEYVQIQTAQGINIELAASVTLDYGYPGTVASINERLRDFVVTPDGSLHLYGGTFDPYLQSYNWRDPNLNNIRSSSGWTTINNVSYGGIDYYQDYIFVTDMNTGQTIDQQNGIIRYSQTGEPTIRFAEGKDFIDLTVGLDNLIYGLETFGRITVYDPQTLEIVRIFTLQEAFHDYRGIAVNQQGEVFAAAWDDNIYYLDSEGFVVDVSPANTTALTTSDFYDINISPDGNELLASDGSGKVALLTIENQSLVVQDVFDTSGDGGNGGFVSFGASSLTATPEEIIVEEETPLPLISISNAEVLEGDLESSLMNFTVTLSEVSNETVEVVVQSDTNLNQENIADPSSYASYNDFLPTTETISFAPGEIVKTFSVEIFGDLELESQEQIFASIDSVVSENALINQEVGIGYINDNEALKPNLSISNAEGLEGSPLEFTISLDQPLNEDLTVEAFTTDNYRITYDDLPTPPDAIAGEDYGNAVESITFAPGETSKTFTVEIIADSLIEEVEQFPVQIITDSSDVYLQESHAIGLITDNTTLDDTIPDETIPEENLVIGEVGYVEDLIHLERTIQFQNEYENPVVIVSPLTRNGTDTAIARITEINSDSFSVFVQEPTLMYKRTHSGEHAEEKFSYLVMEAGTWTMADGTILEVGLTEIQTRTLSSNWDRIEFANEFDSPTVLSSVQTYNNDEFLRLRQRHGDDSGISVALEKEEAFYNSQYAAETVGYIALEAGQNQLPGDDDDINYWAGDSGRTVNHYWTDLGTDNYPYLFASINSFNGYNPSGLRYQMGGEIKLEEDTSRDYEMLHFRENVAFLGFDSLGSIVAEI